MDCNSSEILMMKHMEGLLSAEEATDLKNHVLECETCREYYLAYDEMMEHAALPQAVWVDAPKGFTAAVVAHVFQPEPEVIRRRGLAILHVVWGLGAILLGVALFFAFNPEQLATLVDMSPIVATMATAWASIAAWLAQVSELVATDMPEVGASIILLVFVVVIGSLLFALQRGEEENAASA